MAGVRLAAARFRPWVPEEWEQATISYSNLFD